ncbi:MAG: DNA topoisomerase I [Candidatus Aquicultorales bacterium]
MKLIVTEKNLAAERIAKILSGGKVATSKVLNVPVYSFFANGQETHIIGLKGHILKVDFPAEYSDWQGVEPEKLIDAHLVKVPTLKQLVKALQKEGKAASEVVIATDFDREGELIGLDAATEIRLVNEEVPISRARFSAITKQEIERAFSETDDLYVSLAHAAEARQDIDLIWGATLTRFISLASSRLGKQFLSVGRVQSPTLVLIAEREKERNAFVSEKYWTLKARFADGEEFIASHKTERFGSKEEADGALSRMADSAKVTSVSKTERNVDPPAPFNTTAFLSAAASLGLSTSNAMRAAENMYMRGFISYPRVDNTVYPPSLDLRELLDNLTKSADYGSMARELLAKDELKPTRGKRFATDHPPIHPTGVAKKSECDSAEWKVYDLVVRRFFATLADKAVAESMRVDIDCGGEPFFVRGSRIAVEGWTHFYPYGRKKDEEVPALNEGEIVRFLEAMVDEKETQPPARYSQSKLIQKMEELGLGTKATRHEIIKNLYDRGYVHGDPLIPTETGIAVADTLLKHASRIATPDMTAELEHEMDRIVDGKLTREKVVEDSRRILALIMLDLKQKKEEVGAEIRAGIRIDKVLGVCPKCGGQLKVIRAKKSRKRFVGCANYPECSTSYPLPQYGEIIALNETCDACGAPKIKVLTGKGRPWIICVDPKCPGKAEAKEKRA